VPRFAIAPLGLTTEGSTKFKLKGWKCYLKKLQCGVLKTGAEGKTVDCLVRLGMSCASRLPLPNPKPNVAMSVWSWSYFCHNPWDWREALRRHDHLETVQCSACVSANAGHSTAEMQEFVRHGSFPTRKLSESRCHWCESHWREIIRHETSLTGNRPTPQICRREYRVARLPNFPGEMGIRTLW